MIARLIALLKDKSGVTAIEYGLIAALVGVAIIASVTALGGSLDDMFGRTSDTIDESTASAFGGSGTP